jgi:hypothetical protein
MIERWKYSEILRKLGQFPAVAILGCRQKSWKADTIMVQEHKKAVKSTRKSYD